MSFVKGMDPEFKDGIWDRVYVTTLFTFSFDITVRTVDTINQRWLQLNTCMWVESWRHLCQMS